MKEKVIEFFMNLPESKHEQFNKAFELYRESPNKNVGAERMYNASGYSDQTLDTLLYDLQHLHQVSDVERFTVVAKPVAPSQMNVVDEETVDPLSEEVKDEEESGKAALEQSPEHGLTIREEFPFLNEKDCPNELKILVADKITAYRKYVELQERIANADEKTEAKEKLAELAAQALEAFNENQAIYAELNAYKETGKVLGNHKIFRTLALQREVEEMTNDQLMSFKQSSAKYFSDNKKKIAAAEKAKDEDKVLVLQKRVDERNEKLVLVNKKLGVGQ